jgi:hypothetical protein
VIWGGDRVDWRRDTIPTSGDGKVSLFCVETNVKSGCWHLTPELVEWTFCSSWHPIKDPWMGEGNGTTV